MEVAHNHYRCRVGHAWTVDALLEAHDEEVESALWVALRTLREKANLSRRMANNVGPGMMRQRYMELADEAEHAMSILGKRLSEATSGTGERGDR
jgi:two-component system chemotaxis response regulator CheB